MQTIQNQLIREIRRLGLPVEFALVLGRGAEDGEDDRPHGGVSPPYGGSIS